MHARVEFLHRPESKGSLLLGQHQHWQVQNEMKIGMDFVLLIFPGWGSYLATTDKSTKLFTEDGVCMPPIRHNRFG